MKKIILLYLLSFAATCSNAQSLEECHAMATRNYPLVRQYDLIERTAELNVENIKKGWLPQISINAQATFQSDVTSWPDGMKSMMNVSGLNMKGLKKDQYRIGIDISQTLYDGGTMQNQSNVEMLSAETARKRTDVEIYTLKKRVNELYFSVLLIEDQIALKRNMLEYVEACEEKICSMHENGTASLADLNTLKAERLAVEQQIITLNSQKSTLVRMLCVLCGSEIKNFKKPSPYQIKEDNQRPELRFFDSQIHLIDAQKRLVDSSLRPKVSAFATGFYGYPGYNMFDDMISHKWSLNGMIGLKVSWNIGALYTRKNDLAKLRHQRMMMESDRDVFLFNNRLDYLQQTGEMEKYRELMNRDDEIIGLRTSVRKAAESKLRHGIIDTSELVREIRNENEAKIEKSVHEIEWLKETAEITFTNNSL